jgi:Zn-dependent M28 family amino/carboxypeptidase
VKKLILIGLMISVAGMSYPQGLQAQRKTGKAPLTRTKAQSKKVGEFGNVEGISAAQLKDYLYFIASDEMEGRSTPSRGLDLTAKFLALNLSRWGLKPAGSDGTFFQRFGLQQRQLFPEQTSASVNGQSFKIVDDFLPQPYPGTARGRLVYVGHGKIHKSKQIDPYRGIDVKDKIIVVADGYPKGLSDRDFRNGKRGIDYDLPATYAAAHGARGIIIIPGPSGLNFWNQRYLSYLHPRNPIPAPIQQENRVPTIVAAATMGNAIFAGEKIDYPAILKQLGSGDFGESFDLSPGKESEFTVNAKVDTIATQNVVAVFEGSDPVLKDEYVAIGAHYDHVGDSSKDGCRPVGDDAICNGADDDGSGTVAVLAMAEALAHGPRPKRSILLVWHAGEEKGLWGSDFVTSNPPVPLNRIIAQLNIDMIGRSKKEGDTNRRNANLTGPNEIYVIGSKIMSTELGDLSEAVNRSFLNLKFNYKYDAPRDPEALFYRSDHFNYAKRGIPIIFYFDGVHEDYHMPTDTADKIDYEKMEKVSRTIFATLWKLANAPSRPKIDKPMPAQLLGN